MSNDKLIKNMDPKVWRQLIIWCQQQGIPTAGRNAQTGAIVSEIIRQHIDGDIADTKTKLDDLKDILDRNVIPKRSYWAPPKFIDAIVSKTMNITSPNLIRNYAKLSGYEYDRKRRMYQVPNRATPASQAHLDDKTQLEPEAEKVLQVALDHADKVKVSLNDGEISPAEKKGSEHARAGSGPEKPPHAKVRTVDPNHKHMPICPGCERPVHAKQSSTEIKPKGEVWHDECYYNRKVK